MSSTLNSDNLNGNITSSENLSGTLNSSGTLSGEISLASGGSGTNNYNDLSNKPQINNVTLTGNKTTADLGLFSGNYNDLTNRPTIPNVLNDLSDVDLPSYTPPDYVFLGLPPNSNTWTTVAPELVLSIEDFSDIAITSPTNGQALTYRDGYWENHNISYYSLLNMPKINDVTLSGNKTTADLGLFSGDYNDLTNKPTIPAAQVNSDWNSTSGVSEILNKPTIPDELSDLTDTNISSPTDGQYLKYDSSSSKWVNASGGSGGASALTDLTDTSITTPSGGQVLKYDGTSSKWVNVYLSYNNLVDKPTLATVATSGSYNDLSDKPSIPKADNYTSTPEIVGTWSDGIHTYDVYRKTVFLSSPVTCSAGNTSAAGSWTSIQSGWNNTTIVLDFEAFSYSGNDKTYLGHLSAQWSNTNKDIRVLNIRSVQASIDSFRITYVEP